MICDNRSAIQLRTCSRHRKNTSDRDDLTLRFLKPKIVFFPWIFLAVYRYGYGFCIVAAGTATDCKQKINFILSCYLHALTKLFHSRIRHNSRIFKNLFSIFLQDSYDLVIDTVFLDGTTAIDQLYILSVLRKFLLFPCLRLFILFLRDGILHFSFSVHLLCIFRHQNHIIPADSDQRSAQESVDRKPGMILNTTLLPRQKMLRIIWNLSKNVKTVILRHRLYSPVWR